MSVSLVLLPVALALRVVMGKEGFDEWVRSNEVRYPTDFKSQAELTRVVHGAGFDADDWGGLVKTHIDGEREFIFWELENGVWTAIFSRYQVPEIAERFMKRLQVQAGRTIFIPGEEEEAAPAEVEPAASSVFPTNFRDGRLLMDTLARFGVQAQVQPSGEITTTLGRSPVTFRPGGGESAPYTVEIGNAPDLRGTFEQLSRVDEAYRQGVQAGALATLRERIRDRKLTIEREEVLEDRSVVLTLAIGRR
jgi:hypothetical protein